MDLDLTKEQKILKRSAQDFLKKECPPSLIREMADDERGYPQKLWDQMVDLGWTGVMIPEKYGGIGGSYLDLCILLEAMGEVCCPAPFFSTVVLGGLTLLLAGNVKQKEVFLPKIADGDVILTLATTEPGHFERRVSRAHFQHVSFGQPGLERDLLRLLRCFEGMDPAQQRCAGDAPSGSHRAPHPVVLRDIQRGRAEREPVPA